MQNVGLAAALYNCTPYLSSSTDNIFVLHADLRDTARRTPEQMPERDDGRAELRSLSRSGFDRDPTRLRHLARPHI